MKYLDVGLKPIDTKEFMDITREHKSGTTIAIKNFLASGEHVAEVDYSAYKSFVSARSSFWQISSKYFRGKVGVATRGKRIFLIRKEN